VIELKNVSKWYGPVQVLTNCSTTIQKGEVVVICGPSGSGKSTLIKTINALEPFQQGEIFVDGVAVHAPIYLIFAAVWAWCFKTLSCSHISPSQKTSPWHKSKFWVARWTTPKRVV